VAGSKGSAYNDPDNAAKIAAARAKEAL